MRRLWLAVLLVPVLALAMLALAMPGGASAASSARLAGAARAARAAPGRPVRFGLDTLEAVWAFQEVQGLPGADYVSSAMQRALAHPHAPQLLVPRGGADRIEINLARRVLVLYRGGKVELISHVSAGGGYYYCSSGGCGYAVTPTGNFRTLSFMPGWIAVPLGYMYNPVFFIGTAYAIHGDIPVPLQPVSHGCVRIPMDIAAFFHKLVRIPGEPVYIRY